MRFAGLKLLVNQPPLIYPPPEIAGLMIRAYENPIGFP